MNKFFVLMGFILMFSSCFFAEMSVSDSYSELVTPEFNIQVPDVVRVKSGGVVRIPISIVAKQDTFVDLNKLDTNKLKFQGFLKPVNVEKTLSVPATKYAVYSDCLVVDGVCVGNSITPKVDLKLFSSNVVDSKSLPVVDVVKDLSGKDLDFKVEDGFDSFACDVVENVNGVDYCIVEDGFDLDNVSFVKKIVSVPKKSFDNTLILSNDELVGWIDVVVPRDVGSYKYDVVYGDWVLDPVIVVEDWNVSVPEGVWHWLSPRVDLNGDVYLGWSGWLEHETPVKELDSGSASFFDESVLAYYKFNGDSVDSSDSGFDGSDFNVSWSSGKWGTQAVEFNGVDSVINTGSAWLPTGEMTISVWIYPYSYGATAGRIIDNGSSNLKSYLYITPTRAGFRDLTTLSNEITTPNGSVVLNQWQHFVVTRTNTGDLDFYINGLKATNTKVGTGAVVPGGEVLIGNRVGGDRGFDGLIDELVVFDRVLSADEVRGLYNDASVDKNLVAYYHLNDNNGTHVFNSAPATSDKYHGEIVGDFDTNVLSLWDYNAGYFNGLNAGINTGSDWLPLSNLTFSAWIKPNSFKESGFNSILSNESSELGLYSGIQGLFYKSNGTSWSESYDSSNAQIRSLAVFDDKLYAGTGSNGKILVFDGMNWNESYDSTESYIYSLAVFDDKLYAGTNPNGKVLVFDGSSWSESYDSSETHIYSLAVFDNKLYAGTGQNGKILVFDGSSWSESYDSTESHIYSLAVFDDKLYAGTHPQGKIFVFDGSSWSESYDSTETNIYSLAEYNGKLYAGTGQNGKVLVFDGSTWSESYDSTESNILSLNVFDNKLYAGTNPNGKVLVFDGSSWSESYDSTESSILSLNVFDDKLYAGTHPQGKIFVFDGNELVSSAVNSINLNKWNHIAMSRNANGLTNFYINGLLSGSADQNSGNPTAGLNNVFLGNDTNGLRGFDGLIQDLKVWNKALTQNEVIDDYNAWKSAYYESNIIDVNDEQVINSIIVNEGYPLNSSELSESSVLYDANLIALYNFNGNALDSSLGGHGGSATNVSWKPGLWKTQAVEFNGSNSIIDTGSDWIPLGDLSVSAWIKPYSFGEGGYGRIIDNARFKVYFTSGNQLTFTSNSVSGTLSGLNSIKLNQWQHILVTRDENGIANLYINGELSGSPNQNSGIPVVGTTNVFIGNTVDSSRTFDGLIEDLAVWNKILSPDDINELYLSQAQTIYSQHKTSNEEELIPTISYSNPNYLTDSNISTTQQKYAKVKIGFESTNYDTAKLYNISFDYIDDTNAPTTLASYNSNWINEDENFSFTCFDSENSCKTFYYRTDTNAGVGVNFGSWNAVDWNGNYEIINLIPIDGNIAIEFLSTDQLDNNESSQIIYSTKSKTNPTINITSPTNNYTYFTIDASYSITMEWDSNSYPEPQSNQINTYLNNVKNGTYGTASCIATGEFTKSCSGVVELNLGYAEKKPNTLKAKTVMVSANEVEDSVLVYMESGIESKYPNLIYTGLIILILVGFLLGVFSFISPDSFEVGIWQFVIVIVFVLAMIIAIMGALL